MRRYIFCYIESIFSRRDLKAGQENVYLDGENGKGVIIFDSSLVIRGTVLATHSSQPGLLHICSLDSLR
jgi:hypothetical protein